MYVPLPAACTAAAAGADLYSIIKACEKLERAYVRDAISAKDYEPACQKLIGQFRTLWDTVRSSVSTSAGVGV